MRVPMTGWAGALAVAAAAVAGCGGGGGTTSTTPIAACAAIASPELLYPAPGATGIAPARLQLWVGYGTNPSSFFPPPVLTPNNSSPSLQGSAFTAPSPGPTPAGMLPPRPNEQVFVSDVGGYARGTTYSVSVFSAVCNSPAVIGTFST